MAATGTDDRDNRLPNEPHTNCKLLGVRISPLDYEWNDDDCPDVCYYTDMYGVLYVQERHLKSARMSTWN